MELLFICRDARVDSLLSTMAMALEARKASVEAGDERQLLWPVDDNYFGRLTS
jgi:hypothetical protein